MIEFEMPFFFQGSKRNRIDDIYYEYDDLDRKFIFCVRSKTLKHFVNIWGN